MVTKYYHISLYKNKKFFLIRFIEDLTENQLIRQILLFKELGFLTCFVFFKGNDIIYSEILRKGNAIDYLFCYMCQDNKGKDL